MVAQFFLGHGGCIYWGLGNTHCSRHTGKDPLQGRGGAGEAKIYKIPNYPFLMFKQQYICMSTVRILNGVSLL